MTLHAPQIILLVLMALGLGRSIYKHGEPDTRINAWSSLIDAALSITLLWWGGFFRQ